MPHLRARDVAEVLTRATVRMAKYLRRRDLLEEADDEALDGIAALAASAASGRSPPAGPSFRRGALPKTAAPLSFDNPQAFVAALAAIQESADGCKDGGGP